ncbi:MAG: CHRD domain-containing protein [Chitinophagaceae bacterium]
MRNKLFLSLLFILAISIFSSCDKNDDPVVPDPNVRFSATTISGANESSPNPSTATGSATATFNKDTKILTVNVTFSGVTATAAHIHKGAVGVAGGVIFGFPSPITSPINYTSPALDAAQEADLLANLYYVNIHSTAYPGGEIRGQLIKQ